MSIESIFLSLPILEQLTQNNAITKVLIALHFCLKKSGCVARIVFEVSLEGSARKLVTVRSALRLVNKLPHAVEVRVDHAPAAGK